MQGWSGSGKSSFAKGCGFHNIISADDYFTDEKGNYNFDESKLDEAHMDCLIRVVKLMQYSDENITYVPKIVLDNTNCRPEDISLYKNKAKQYGYEIVYIRMNGDYEGKAPDTIIDQQKQDLNKYNYEENYEKTR